MPRKIEVIRPELELNGLNSSSDLLSQLEEEFGADRRIVFDNGTYCFRTPEGGRCGVFPVSKIRFTLRARTIGDSQKLERAMGGQAEVQKYTSESLIRMFCQICIQFGEAKNCTTSQINELDELGDGMYLINVMSSFQPRPPSSEDS